MELLMLLAPTLLRRLFTRLMDCSPQISESRERGGFSIAVC